MMTSRRSWLALLTATVLTLGAGTAPAPAQGRDVLVFAAASLKNALDEIAGAVAARDRQEGRDLLRREQHADQADRAGRAGRHLHLRRSRLDGLRPAEGPDQARHPLEPARQQARADRAEGFQRQPRISSPASISRQLLKGGRLAMGNVDAVPAGKYGKAALEKLGAWDGVKDKIAQAESVRAALLSRRARRGAARHRLPDRRGGRTDRQDRRHLPRRHASADHLSDRADEGTRPIRTQWRS